MIQVRVTQNFVTPEQSKDLIDFFNEFPFKIYDGIYGKYANGREMVEFMDTTESKKNGFKSSAIVWRENCENKDFGNTNLNEIVKKLCNHFKQLNPNYINEYVSFIRMGAGSHIVNHTDGIINETDGTYVPLLRPDYVITSVTYLNSDFTGGELVLENQYVHKPEIYSMIEFPGGTMEHSVSEIKSGARYALVGVFDYPDEYEEVKYD